MIIGVALITHIMHVRYIRMKNIIIVNKERSASAKYFAFLP